MKAAGLDPNAPEDGSWNTLVEAAKTARWTLRFAGGELVVFQAFDGGPDSEGSSGMYTVTDDHTLVLTDTGVTPPDVTTFHFSLVGTKLTMKVVSDTRQLSIVAATGIFNTAPFIRQP